MKVFQHVNFHGSSPSARRIVRMRCPGCRILVTFEGSGNDIILADPGGNAVWFVGHRRCANEECHAYVTCVWNVNDKLLTSYPPERVDFDTSGVPQPVVDTMEEAITCHAAGAYRAAAVMVRKTVEVFCETEGAKGSNLKQRLEALKNSQRLTLPAEYVEGLTELRVLGNDATHVELKDFDEVGHDEATVALAIAKEILRDFYQRGATVAALKALKTKQSMPQT